MTRPLLTTVLLAFFTLIPSARALARDPQSWLQPSPLVPGLLWRGRAPYGHQHYEVLRQMGVRTVLDIRGNQPFASAQERRRAEAHGLVYRKVRISFRPLRGGSAERVLAAMQNDADYPMYVHCNVDRDRTSVAVAAFRVRAQGWDGSAAAAEARQFGLRRYFVGLNRYLRSVTGSES
jgi:hypothetical protein